MRFEKSCGAVIFAVEDGQTRYLIERMRGGHVSLCKGHVEAGETEHETARREIREETALSVRFVDGFRETISYSPYEGCMKEVVFFLAQAEHTRTVAQECEVAQIFWMAEEDALGALTYADDRRVLSSAARHLEQIEKNNGRGSI